MQLDEAVSLVNSLFNNKINFKKVLESYINNDVNDREPQNIERDLKNKIKIISNFLDPDKCFLPRIDGL